MVSIETTKVSDYKRIEEIYLDSFPKSERKPFPMLISGIKKGSAEMLSVFQMGHCVGLHMFIFTTVMLLLTILPWLKFFVEKEQAVRQ